MRWIDVAGLPGSGKSELCDQAWPPRCIDTSSQIEWPSEWANFLTLTAKYLKGIEGHPSYRACESMTKRSFKKMSAVQALNSDKVYTQTGFAQRGLGIAWRLKDVGKIEEYFRRMPVSLGIVLLHCGVDELRRRNIARGKDRSHMLVPMAPAMLIASTILSKRGIPVLDLNVEQPIEVCRARLNEFICTASVPCDGSLGLSDQMALL